MPGKSFLRLVESSEDFTSGVWRLNNNLLVNKNAVFPDRCIICNQPACGRFIRKTFVWHSPLLLPVIAISFPFYVVLASLLNKILRVEVPVCPQHGNRIFWGTSIALLMIPQFVILGLLGLSKGIPAFILAGIVVSLVGGGLLIWTRNPVWAWFIRSEYGLIKGAHPDFMKNFPDWDGEAL